MNARCPYCGHEVELDEERRGRPVRCPECGEGFRAPLQDQAEGLPPVTVSKSDRLMLAASVVAGIGTLLMLAAMLAVQMGHFIGLPGQLLTALTVLPIAVVFVSWWGARTTERHWLVWLSRLLGYLWLASIVMLWLMIRRHS